VAAEAACDLAILGAGPGGTAAADHAAALGGRVCLIEQGPLGGVCLNVGCIPSKAMLHASDSFWRAGHGGTFGVSSGQVLVDGAAYMRHVADVVATCRTRLEQAIGSRKGIDLVRGRGRLLDSRTIRVESAGGTREVRARAVIVATGSRAARPPALPWDSGLLWTTDEATTALSLPPSLVVVGGGVIGSEMATVFAELGIPTTVVEMMDRLLPAMDEEAGKAVAESLAQRGATILTGRRVARVTAEGDAAAVELDDGRRLSAGRVLIAVGRKPNVEGIGLEAAGVSIEDGIIPVDDRCRTNVEGTYAIGDAAEKRQHAHLAERMGVVAADNALGGQLADDRTVVPIGIYTHPEVATVGAAQAEAKQRFGRVAVCRASYSHSSMALACDEQAGGVKVLADPDSGLVRGATWIGPHATDMIHELALAMRHGLTLEQIAQTIHAHPTFQEALGEAAGSWLRQRARRRG